VPDVVLDYHRLKVPIDHPDSSVTRGKLEYPTVDVSFAYLASISKAKYVTERAYGYLVLARDAFADKAVWCAVQVNAYPTLHGRLQDYYNFYDDGYNPGASAGDHYLEKIVAGSGTRLATEAIDIDYKGRGLALSCSGSTIKSLRYELTSAVDPLSLPTANATISATDTSFASGYYGFKHLRETASHGGSESGSAWLKAPLSPLPSAQAILELNVGGSGRLGDPYEPSMGRSLAEISTLTGLPDFLYQESEKYSMLKAKGFTDYEINLMFGCVPQHQIDLDSVTWGSFEFSEKSSTNIIMVYGDNPYKAGAVQRQMDYAESKNLRVFAPPKDYGDVVSLYNRLKGDFKHWLAGKDSFAYQVLGTEDLEPFAVADFYYGELVEHRTHYDQLKQVPDWEMAGILNMWLGRLMKATVLAEEREKHIEKLRAVLKRGW
jgi:hypothetical protein